MDKEIIIKTVINELRKTLSREMSPKEADGRVEICANLLELLLEK